MNNKKVAEELVKVAKLLTSRVNERDVLKGYLSAALWTATDDDGDNLDDKYKVSDIDKGSVNDAKRDIRKFLSSAKDLSFGKNDDSRIGHDLWLTANGHGAGFWDGDYPDESEDELSKLAKKVGEKYMYVGDDGKVYID